MQGTNPDNPASQAAVWNRDACSVLQPKACYRVEVLWPSRQLCWAPRLRSESFCPTREPGKGSTPSCRCMLNHPQSWLQKASLMHLTTTWSLVFSPWLERPLRPPEQSCDASERNGQKQKQWHQFPSSRKLKPEGPRRASGKVSTLTAYCGALSMPQMQRA